MAKLERHAKFLRNIDFDMVIVDEAHKLKNRDTLNWKFVNSLNKKYCLLLTATPIHNNLKELYNLISILYPNIYNDYRQFKDKYVKGKYMVKNSEDLQDDLEQVMIRNHHSETALNLSSQRNVYQISVELTPKERKLYDMVTNYVKQEYRRRISGNKSILHLLTYQREICSCSYALQCTLEKKKNRNAILDRIFSLTQGIDLNAKIKEVIKIMKKRKDKQVIIFTEYRATQAYIAYHLEEKGYSTILFNGGLSSSGKEWIKNVFHNKKDVMISTEAGSQGLNLQFCNIIINYDLPWNPMKVEQRIGRVHRLGQAEDVHIYNLATKDSIEEKILNVLYKKIHLFKSIVGKMEDILKPEGEISLKGDIMKIIGESENEKDVEEGFKSLLNG
jgi:SNF2 family DNA or RNA helicase